MKTIQESAVLSLDGTDTEIFPFLPDILQDLWEIGSDPNVILEAVIKHSKNYSHLNILDLGCGKGAVSIRIAERLHCRCLGIDAIEEFISEANCKASEYGVGEFCTFEVGDIRKMIDTLSDFDIAILGSIGPVFGNYTTTLSSVSKALKKDGVVIIDDGYIMPGSDFHHPHLLHRNTLLQQIDDAGMKLMDEIIINPNEIKSSDDYIFNKIEHRCSELADQYPEKKHLFDNYVKKQIEENDVLENRIVCSTMIVRKQ